jgi:hypothetical protein
LATALPLPQLRLPYVFSEAIGPHDVDTLAAALADGVGGLRESAEAST